MLRAGMILERRSLAVLLSICIVVCWARGAAAQDRTARQIELLQRDQDLRVRTQAALALGASNNASVVPALCRALADENYIVRMAAALAISKLQKGGSECLRERLAVEKVSSVLYTLETSLARVGEAPPRIDETTRFYVSLTEASHDTGRSQVPGMVRQRMRDVASSLGGIAIAPSGETLEQAEAVFKKHKQLKGYQLSPKLTLQYADGKVSLRLSVALLSYPEKNLLGRFSKSVASPGVTSRDPGIEDELIQIAAEAAMKQFSSVAPTL